MHPCMQPPRQLSPVWMMNFQPSQPIFRSKHRLLGSKPNVNIWQADMRWEHISELLAQLFSNYARLYNDGYLRLQEHLLPNRSAPPDQLPMGWNRIEQGGRFSFSGSWWCLTSPKKRWGWVVLSLHRQCCVDPQEWPRGGTYRSVLSRHLKPENKLAAVVCGA